jgi:antitoxin component YwqK of YwqJK toxin-antitoxin module
MQTEIKREYYDNGNLHYECQYVNGILHGIQKLYYDNNQLSSKYQMKHGKEYGLDPNWHRDGRRHFVQQWKNNQTNGPIIIFRYEL